MDSHSRIAKAVQGLLGALDRIEIRYAVGGSVASSIHGNYRFTSDVDFLVDMAPEQIAEFVRALGPGYYTDAETIGEQFRRGRPANVIHMGSAYKFDLFPATGHEFHESELRRSRHQESTAFGERIKFQVASAEDTVLAKLRGYRETGGASEQQWKELAGVVTMQGSRLDRAYLSRWAKELGVEELLGRLLPPAE